MGWCSGTEIFDNVAESILSDKPIDKKQLLIDLIDTLESKDWDCQCESVYWDDPLVREIFMEREPEWFEDEDEEEEMSESDRRFGQPHYGHDYSEE